MGNKMLTARCGGTGLLLAVSLGLGACAKSEDKSSASIPKNAVVAQASAPDLSRLTQTERKNLAPSLARISEPMPGQSYTVWLSKEFWLGKDIWLSMGVERSNVTGLAMSVLGYLPTRIEREGNLLVLKQRSKGTFGGTVLEPEVGINAYPILSESATEMLVDLANPQTPYGLSMTNFWAGSDSSTELQPRLEYLKEVRVDANRVSFFQVNQSKSPVKLFSPDDGTVEADLGQDPYMVSMSLRIDWVPEIGAPDFKPLAAPIQGLFDDRIYVSSTGLDKLQFANVIDISKPMAWEMSANTPEAYRDAVAAGVTLWNEAFGGKEQLTVKLADGSRTLTDPAVSNVVWDDNQAVGMAFANWRSNPYTGQIVQAQVYMSGNMWAANGHLVYQMRKIEQMIRGTAAPAPTPGTEPEPGPMPVPASGPEVLKAIKALKQELKSLAKGQSKTNDERRLFLGFNRATAHAKSQSGHFCMRQADSAHEMLAQLAKLEVLARNPSLRDEVLPSNPLPPVVATNPGDVDGDHNPYPAEGQSAEDFAKGVVRAVVLHEVGHAIGLRHNFIASTTTSNEGKIGSASIMDYNDLVVDAQFDRPGSYDLAAVKAAYLDRRNPKELLFCTDDGVRAGVPGCNMHDYGTNPIKGLSQQGDSALLMGLKLLEMGQVDLMIRQLRRSISTLNEIADYVVYSSEEGAIKTRDADFASKQKAALDKLDNAIAMNGYEYPEELKKLYGEITKSILVNRITDKTVDSAMIGEVLSRALDVASDVKNELKLDTRKVALNGLVKAQSNEARANIVKLAAILESKLKTSDMTLESKMSDDELLNLSRGILMRGYFSDSSDN